MKKQIFLLKQVLKTCGYVGVLRDEIAVYLSVVFLAKRLEEVAAYFQISYAKAQAILCTYGVKLNNKDDRSFYKSMHRVTKMFKRLESQTTLNLKVA